LLDEYAVRDSRVRVFTTPNNLGYASKTTRFGTRFIRGSYYAYASQDDLFSADWLSCCYSRAVETGADAVVGEMVFFYKDSPEKNFFWPIPEELKHRVISGQEALIYSLDETIHNFALWGRHLVDEIGYYDFGMRADEYTYRVWYQHCNKVAFSPGTFYYRFDNSEAITQKLTLKSFDTPYNTLRLWKLAKENGAPRELQKKLILDSIYELLHFNEMAYSLNFSGGKQKILQCYSAYLQEDVSGFLKSLPTNDRRLLVARLATKSYTVFAIWTVCRLRRRVFRKALRPFPWHRMRVGRLGVPKQS
ncbi:MAG: glycosyltransferase, partial [Xanthobacteraceae bacterium]